MNRIRNNKKKLLVVMGPKMFRIMERIKTHYEDRYFDMTNEEKEKIVDEICSILIKSTFGFFNQYTKEELPDIYDLVIINLSQMEEYFVEVELYGFAQMIRDSILTLENDLSNLVEPELP